MAEELEDAIADLEAQILEAVGDDLQDDINVDLVNLAGQIRSRLLAGDFENRSGALRRSMVASVIGDNALRISMLFYGYYVSFGVKPKRTEGLPLEVAEAWGRDEGSEFGPSKWGIKARNFYPQDLVEQVLEIIADDLQKL